MKMIHPIRREQGNALILALMFAVTLTAIAGSGMQLLQAKYRSVHQAASWEEALLTSEAGIDLAVNEMRKSLFDPQSAWQGWHTAPGGSSPATPTAGTAYFSSTILLRQSEGGNRSWAEVAVDAPVALQDSTGEQYYRVRSLGIAEVPGGSVAVGGSVDAWLRKLDLRVNRRTGQAINSPRATRLIEAIVKPVGTFQLALMGIQSINLNNHNIVVDSYDSRLQATAAEMANGSLPKYVMPTGTHARRENGHIATNGTLIQAGSAQIYGTASTNGGTVLNASNVSGAIRNDFYQDILPVEAPAVTPTSGTPSSVTTATTIVASAGAPTQVLLSQIKLSGNNNLRIQGAADGSETFVQIVVTGDVDLKGNSEFILDPGVYVRIFVKGNTDIGGNGVTNPNQPTNFQFYGVDRSDANGNVSSMGSIKIAGNGGFRGSLYAPHYDISMVGGGNSDSIYGSFLGNTVGMTGVQSVHYDEALADGGLISNFKVVSWFEDVR